MTSIPQTNLKVSESGIQHFKQGFAVPISDFNFLSFSGNDAKSFLHRMLTNEVSNLNENTARMGGYCTPQGRVTANFIYWETQGKIFFFLPGNQSDYLAKRLRIYVLRDNVKIEILEFLPLGIGGKNAEKTLGKYFPAIPQAYEKTSSENGTLIRVSDFLDSPRYLWIVNKEKTEQIWKNVSKELTVSDNALWHLADINAGIAYVTEKTREKFTPQMLNMDLINAVSFKKGCYPGQEIIARTQHIGKTPKRTYLFEIHIKNSDTIENGMNLLDEKDEPVLQIINAEKSKNNTYYALAVANINFPKELKTAKPNALIKLKPLPY